jgi:hypothetical protein
LNLPNGTYPAGDSPYSIFFVLTFVSGAFILGAGPTNANQALVIGVNPTNIFDAWYANDANGTSTYNLANSTFIGETVYTQSVNRQLFVTGNLTQTFASSGHALVSTDNIIGGYRALGLYSTFNLKEVIVYNVALTIPQRQQVEGYLAWKWGLQASLPGDHLYKTAAPT